MAIFNSFLYVYQRLSGLQIQHPGTLRFAAVNGPRIALTLGAVRWENVGKPGENWKNKEVGGKLIINANT